MTTTPNILLIGTSSGIGEATAKPLGRLRGQVIIGTCRTDRLEQLASEFRAQDGTIKFRALDSEIAHYGQGTQL